MNLSSQKLFEDLTHAQCISGIGEDRSLTIERPQTGMDMTGRAHIFKIRFSHKGDGASVSSSDFFGGIFVQVIAISHLNRRRI